MWRPTATLANILAIVLDILVRGPSIEEDIEYSIFA
jgi:hypothetical protein